MKGAIKELEVETVSKCTEDGTAYIVVLREKCGERILPVLIEKSEAYLLLMEMDGNKRKALPSSMSDIMWAAFMQCDMRVEEVRIVAVEGGVTYCHVLYSHEGVFHMIRYCKASDCLILAYTFDCPITIGETLLEHQYMRKTGDGTYSIPANSVGMDALKEALKRAVEDENYELASLLRDEIERRK